MKDPKHTWEQENPFDTRDPAFRQVIGGPSTHRAQTTRYLFSFAAFSSAFRRFLSALTQRLRVSPPVRALMSKAVQRGAVAQLVRAADS
jgi:hypothetical protein